MKNDYITLRSIPFVPTLGLSLALLLGAATCRADTIYGPTDHNGVGAASIVDVTTIASAALNGADELVITYSVERTETSAGDSWLTLTFNTDTPHTAFTSSGVLGVLLRTMTDSSPGDHQAFQATGGSWSPNGTSVDMDATTPVEHAVRITVTGLASGGFNGAHPVTIEFDHNASSFVTADRTFSGGTVDFGTDDQLNIDVRGQNKNHNVKNLTVSQAPTTIPTFIMLEGGLALLAVALLGYHILRQAGK